MAKTRSELAAVLGGMSRVAEGLREERLAADEQVPDMMLNPEQPGEGTEMHYPKELGDPREHTTDGSPCWCQPTVVTEGGFEILPEEPESRPNPPARGKYPRLLQTLLDRGLAPGRPAMSIRVPEGEEPLLVAEGLKREGRRVGQGEWLRGSPEPGGGPQPWYVEAWVHPKKERIVQVLAKEGVAPYTKKPKGEAR